VGSITVLSFVFVAVLNQFVTRDLKRALDDATYDLVQANRKLEEASKLKSQFTARTSHELRTPLSAIIVFTDLALRKMYGPLTEKLEDSLERVLLSAKRLNTLIEDILDLSKIEAGEIEIYEEAFEVSHLVETVHSTLETAAAEKQLDFTIQLSSSMPETIIGDEKRLSQVLINLTHNAIKFTDTGSVKVSIEELNGPKWKMTVKDTGRGINEEHFESIFDEFRQVKTEGSDTRTKGTGLGLAITRQLVEMMAGNVTLTSTLGKGSSFQVTLPLKTPHENAVSNITRTAWKED
jgi:signal transduction histidine kinase